MTDTSTFKKYSDPVIYHDGRGGQFHALVLGTRVDPGVTLGPDGQPVITLLYLDPTKVQNGPLKGDLADASVIQHDVPYLADQELYAVGYNDELYTYPVVQTETMDQKLARLEAELAALKSMSGSFTTPAAAAVVTDAAGNAVTAAVPPSSPVSLAEQHEAKSYQTTPVIPSQMQAAADGVKQPNVAGVTADTTTQSSNVGGNTGDPGVGVTAAGASGDTKSTSVNEDAAVKLDSTKSAEASQPQPPAKSAAGPVEEQHAGISASTADHASVGA